MSTTFPLITYIIFVLLALVPKIPLHLRVVSYFSLFHLDLSGFHFNSATSIGLENAIKSIIIPTILVLRSNFYGSRLLIRTFTFKIWIILGIYIAFALAWSPFPLSAIKQLGYFYTYTINFLLLANLLWALNPRQVKHTIYLSTSVALILGLLQTYVFGNIFGTVENRFTSFTSPQSFALFLSFILGVIILAHFKIAQKMRLSSFLFPGIILIFIFLTGSRIALVMSLFLISAIFFFWALSGNKPYRIILLNILFLIILVTFFPFANNSPTASNTLNVLTENRALQTLSLIQDGSLQNISTFRFRTAMFSATIHQLKHKNQLRLLFGNGTSSIGEVVTEGHIYYRGYNETNIDANRIAHNEFLRSLFEWGILGLLIFFSLTSCLFFSATKLASKLNNARGYIYLASFFNILIVLLTSNMLAASGTPMGVGLSIYLIYWFIEIQQTKQNEYKLFISKEIASR